jgi:menaquinone-dependent protoporphyrinogen oxidase
MKFLLLYATTEGQTRKVFRHLADRLVGAGHSVELLDGADAEGLDPTRFDAAILGGSLHAGRYQPALLAAAHGQAAALSALPGLFVSVSLTAAADDPGERAELDRLAAGFLSDAGWQGAQVLHVAGALRFGAYGFFEYWAMRWIARHRGMAVEGRETIELTDWAALDSAVDAFAVRVAAGG